MNQNDINQLIKIRSFDEMSDAELDNYAQIFLDKIEEQFDHFDKARNFWCPKCESPMAEVEIDEVNAHAIASCPICRMAVVMVTRENGHAIDSELESDSELDDEDENPESFGNPSEN